MSPTKQARLSSLFTPSAVKVASLSQSQQEPDDFAISPLPSAVAGSRRTVPLSSTDRSRIDRVLRENAHLLPSTKRGASASLLRSSILQARSTPKNRSTIFEIHPISNADASPPLQVEDVSRMPSSTKTDMGKGKVKEVIFPSPSESGWSHRRHTMGYTAVENQFMNESFGGGSVRGRIQPPSLATSNIHRALHDTHLGCLIFRCGSFLAGPQRSPALSELELVTDYGVQCVIAGMVENHGFNAETVRKVCANARSLRLADHVLCRMRESANECADEVLQSLQQEEEEEEDDDEEGHSTLLLSHIDRVRPRYGQAFEYSPIPGSPRTDESIAADMDFVPPKSTRAGQFVRLVREGRADEARRRESLRASGAGLSSPLESDLGSDDEDVFVEQSLLADVETNTSDTPFFGTGDTPDLVPLARSRNLKGLRQLENTMGRGSVKILTGRLVDEILARHKV
ncbi:hypothetical protein A0H81_04952 [Grifola frondosa]|uniref:Uncharacterized protein n=1 Tax=Grifola frondosa TaxID=5627 RepID=A0A1C7ME30_GRIFR|nr:hypothetical protein A0H81_04952 [Grifola frondosa]